MAELGLKESSTLAADDQQLRGYIDRQCDEILKAMGEIFAGHRATVSTTIDKLKQRITKLEGQVEDLTPTVCGTYDADAKYKKLSIVALNGAAFISKCADPGVCPGNDWKMISRQGCPGRRGERGDKGARGDPGLSVTEYRPDVARWRFLTIMSDGSVGPVLDLQAIAERLYREILNQVEAGK